MNYFEDKSLLITGGTGSFGQAFVREALSHNPKLIRIYSRGEQLQIQMARDFQDKRLRFVIGDIRDKAKLTMAMRSIDVVVHAAALKMIPPGEENPEEFIKTNILGSMNVVDGCLEAGVERAFAISTDKAAHPCNLYGATKMAMEKVWVNANAYGDTKFSCSRYGNVMDARGEVLDTFLKQAQGECFTITDKRMTRFWLTVNEGMKFVTGCIEKMKGGEIFIPKGLPSFRIEDLALAINSKASFSYTGIRPGEKLGEILISEDEARHSREEKDCYIIEPELPWARKGGGLPEGFQYGSSTTKFLSIEEIKERLSGLHFGGISS